MKNFILGANYWASNAGAEMWINFCEETIDHDLATLSENGLEYLRVFPNWRDFQPVMPLTIWDYVEEYRLSGERKPENKYYLDEVAMERFEIFCEIAKKHNIKIIVGLITGWMSGRLFIPPALYGKNLFTDATALLFQQKFITGFVKRFKDREEIYAWDLGNECNAMNPVESRAAAHNWALTLSNCICANDNSRPIISGMHSLTIEGDWTMEDQGDATDILTTHPYPYWSEHTRNDTYSSIRTLLHGTAETKLYRDISGKPCFVEELGTMGPMNCSDEISAGFARCNMFSNWANGAMGVMWWCAHEQDKLTTAPYTWVMCEIELGMTDSEGAPKPVLKEFKKFNETMSALDLKLPSAHEDAVCILTRGQDHWGVAYMSYILAKQAGVNLRFSYSERELPESNVYIMPSVKGHLVMERERYLDLIERVKGGATLYISNDECIFADFNALTGTIVENSRRNKRFLKPNGAKVLKADDDGNPLFTKYRLGQGYVYYLDIPLESSLLDEVDAFADDHFEYYNEVFKKSKESHILTCSNKDVGITQHFGENGEDKHYVVLINYSGDEVKLDVSINEHYRLSHEVLGNKTTLEPFGAAIIEFESL